MIPEAAVEAAAAAAYEDVRPRMGFPTGFADAPTPMRDTYRSMARAALEAAAPHMLARAKAEALRDAAEAICEWIGDPSPGGPLTEADWLRARADAWDAGFDEGRSGDADSELTSQPRNPYRSQDDQ